MMPRSSSLIRCLSLAKAFAVAGLFPLLPALQACQVGDGPSDGAEAAADARSDSGMIGGGHFDDADGITGSRDDGGSVADREDGGEIGSAAGGGEAGGGSGGSGDPGGTGGVQAAATVFDVEWKASTTVLDQAAQEEAGMEVGEGTATFATPSDAIASLAAGSHVLIEGQGVFEVVSTSTSGDAVSLELEETALFNAAERGRIEWDIHFEPDHAIVRMPADADSDWLVEKQSGESLNYSGTVNGVRGSLNITGAEDHLRVSMSASIPALTPYTFTGTGEVKRAEATGVYAFEDGKITEYQQLVRGLEFQGEFSIEGQGRAFEQDLRFPVGIYFPLTLGPLPAYLGISGSVRLRSTAMSEDAGRVSARVAVMGDSGVQLAGEDGFGPAGSMQATTLEVMPGDFSTRFTSGIGFVVDFPRVELGMGALLGPSIRPPSTSASFYLKVKAEAIQNVTVEVSVATGVRRWCKQASANAATTFGGQVKAFGISFNRDATLWSQRGPVSRTGPDCDTVSP